MNIFCINSMQTGYKVCDAMTEKPVMIKKDASLMKCANVMKDNHVGALIINDKGSLHIITEQDIVRRGVSLGLDPERTVSSEIMTDIVQRIEPQTDVYDALVMMRDFNIRHLPVMDKDNMIGLLTLKDILNIEPQLFDILVEKFELKEVEQTPINSMTDEEGVCNLCGVFSDKLNDKDNVLVCEKCN